MKKVSLIITRVTLQSSKERMDFLINCTGTNGNLYVKKKIILNPYLTSYITINSTWIIAIKVGSRKWSGKRISS